VGYRFCCFARKAADGAEGALGERRGRIILWFINVGRMNVLLRRRKNHQLLLNAWLFCGLYHERYERLSIGKFSFLDVLRNIKMKKLICAVVGGLLISSSVQAGSKCKSAPVVHRGAVRSHVLTSTAVKPQQKDVVDTAVSAGSFKTLVAAVKAAGLVDTLKGEGPFTVTAEA
jgi:hypothetical protein